MADMKPRDGGATIPFCILGGPRPNFAFLTIERMDEHEGWKRVSSEIASSDDVVSESINLEDFGGLSNESPE